MNSVVLLKVDLLNYYTKEKINEYVFSRFTYTVNI